MNQQGVIFLFYFQPRSSKLKDYQRHLALNYFYKKNISYAC